MSIYYLIGTGALVFTSVIAYRYVRQTVQDLSYEDRTPGIIFWRAFRLSDSYMRNDQGYTSLHMATRYKRMQDVRTVLEKVDPNATDNNEDTALHLALRYERKRQVIQLLLERGANAQAANHEGDTPLYMAAHAENEEILRLLFEKGNVTTENRLTALHVAAAHADTKAMQLLLRYGANITMDLSRISATYEQLQQAVQLFLSPEADATGKTPLHTAAETSNELALRLLLAKGADITAIDKSGHTPWTIAACNTSELSLRIFLEHGVDPNAIDKEGSAFTCAMGIRDINRIEKPNMNHLRLLLQRGINPIIIGKKGAFPSHWQMCLFQSDIEKVIALFAQYGINLNVQDEQGYTLLHDAALSKSTGIVRSLLENGANLTLLTETGNTALHEAIKPKWWKNDDWKALIEPVVELLLAHSINPNVQNKRGETPLYLAAKEGFTSVVKLLLANGADPNITDNQGLLPLHVTKDYTVFVELLRGRTLLKTDMQTFSEAFTIITSNIRKYWDMDLKNTILWFFLGNDRAAIDAYEYLNSRHDTFLPLDAMDRNLIAKYCLFVYGYGYANVSKNYVDIYMRNYDGDTALHVAAKLPIRAEDKMPVFTMEEKKRILEILLWRGADPTAVNERGYRPLWDIVQFNDTDLIQRMLMSVHRSSIIRIFQEDPFWPEYAIKEEIKLLIQKAIDSSVMSLEELSMQTVLSQKIPYTDEPNLPQILKDKLRWISQ